MKCLMLILCVWVLLLDDLDSVTFEGKVTDIAGKAIAGARVTARQTANSHERSTTTDIEGSYRLTKLTPGNYNLSVEANGFQTVKYEGINAVSGTTARRDSQMQPAAIESSVTIDATTDSPLVDTTRTVVGGTITLQQIDNLPTESRNPLDLIFTLPGTAPPAFSTRELAEGDSRETFRSTPEEAGNFALNGGTPFSNNITIEGLDNNDDRAARERINLSTDAVEEVQVITNQFSSEYGRASGGRVNLRLRGGANRIRGRAFYYFRDESLNANSFNRNADPTRGFRIPFQSHNPGGSIGGPIVRNKIFFFGAYEYDNILDNTEIVALLPVETNPSISLPKPNGANLGSTAYDRNGRPITVNGGVAVGLYDLSVATPRKAHTFQTRADFKFGAKHDAHAVITFARDRDERGFPGGRRTLDRVFGSGRNSQSYAFSDNLILSSKMVNTARFQFSRLTPLFTTDITDPFISVDIDDPRDVIGDSTANPLSRTGKLNDRAATPSGVDRREVRYQIQDTLSYVRGPHTMRFGGDIQIIRSRFVDLEDRTGFFEFPSPADYLADRPSRYRHRFFTESELRNTYTGFFVQDDWKFRPNITLSFGLRWDDETIVDDHNNFGPRLSFAWDPFKTGKTVVRAGYGIFYNRALLRTLDDFILTSNTILIDTNNATAKRLLSELQFPNVLAPDDPRVAQLGVSESGFLRLLEKDFRIPESYQASLGFEREISKGFKIEVNYVFNRGLHLWRSVNPNAPRLPAGFGNFAEYLTSRDFDNSINPATGQRPITQTGNADVARFNLSRTPSQTITEGSRRVVIIGLNNQSTANNSISSAGALAAIRNLRPNPDLTQVDELQSRGNSYYHGVSFEIQRRVSKVGFIRASYTLSKLIDDGPLNNSEALIVGDFKNERALSFSDARHRFAISGNYPLPAFLGRLNLSGTFNYSSSRPFTIGANGNDRNLDDVDNDRPIFTGNLDEIVWRRSTEPLDQALIDSFALPTIGTTGNLPRNVGRGPAGYTLNLRLSRDFRLAERRKIQLMVEAFNPFNSTVFSIGAEFVNYNPASLSTFLVPRRVVKPRTMRVGVRFDF